MIINKTLGQYVVMLFSIVAAIGIAVVLYNEIGLDSNHRTFVGDIETLIIYAYIFSFLFASSYFFRGSEVVIERPVKALCMYMGGLTMLFGGYFLALFPLGLVISIVGSFALLSAYKVAHRDVSLVRSLLFGVEFLIFITFLASLCAIGIGSHGIGGRKCF